MPKTIKEMPGESRPSRQRTLRHRRLVRAPHAVPPVDWTDRFLWGMLSASR
jgi:hypothetical protein